MRRISLNNLNKKDSLFFFHYEPYNGVVYSELEEPMKAYTVIDGKLKGEFYDELFPYFNIKKSVLFDDIEADEVTGFEPYTLDGELFTGHGVEFLRGVCRNIQYFEDGSLIKDIEFWDDGALLSYSNSYSDLYEDYHKDHKTGHLLQFCMKKHDSFDFKCSLNTNQIRFFNVNGDATLDELEQIYKTTFLHTHSDFDFGRFVFYESLVLCGNAIDDSFIDRLFDISNLCQAKSIKLRCRSLTKIGLLRIFSSKQLTEIIINKEDKLAVDLERLVANDNIEAVFV